MLTLGAAGLVASGLAFMAKWFVIGFIGGLTAFTIWASFKLGLKEVIVRVGDNLGFGTKL